VKVTASTDEGGTRRSVMVYAMRCVMTRVLALPAPARMGRALGMGHRFALLRVKAFEKVHEIREPRLI